MTDQLLYIATGSGAGHVRRAAAVLRYLDEDSASIVSTSPQGMTIGKALNVGMYGAPSDPIHRRHFLHGLISSGKFGMVIIDAFPFGVDGDLGFPWPNIHVVHVARHLRWDAYLKASPYHPAIPYRAAFICEELEPDHLQWVLAAMPETRCITLDYHIDGETTSYSRQDALIVHTGPDHSLAILHKLMVDWMIAHGGGRCLILSLLPFLPANIPTWGAVPCDVEVGRLAVPYLAAGAMHGAHLFCGGGLVLREALAIGFPPENIHAYPFSSRFCDQAWRIDNCALLGMIIA